MSSQLPPVTPASIAAARIAAALERHLHWERFGDLVTEDGRLAPRELVLREGRVQFDHGTREFLAGVALGAAIGSVGGASLGARPEHK